MDKEACPHCKSENTEKISVDGETWWVCHHQGCSGRVSAGKFYWHPGEGLPPKPPKADKKKPAPDDGGDSAEV